MIPPALFVLFTRPDWPPLGGGFTPSSRTRAVAPKPAVSSRRRRYAKQSYLVICNLCYLVMPDIQANPDMPVEQELCGDESKPLTPVQARRPGTAEAAGGGEQAVTVDFARLLN